MFHLLCTDFFMFEYVDSFGLSAYIYTTSSKTFENTISCYKCRSYVGHIIGNKHFPYLLNLIIQIMNETELINILYSTIFQEIFCLWSRSLSASIKILYSGIAYVV